MVVVENESLIKRVGGLQYIFNPESRFSDTLDFRSNTYLPECAGTPAVYWLQAAANQS